MADGYNGSLSIRFENLPEVQKAMRVNAAEISRSASFGLRAAGMNIIADAQRNLQRNGSWVTGHLANSGRVIYGGKGFDTGTDDARTSREASDALMKASTSDIDLGLDAGFFDTDPENKNGYALWVEYGRPAGGPPPLKSILRWMIKKFKTDDIGLAENIRWKIAHYGSKPHPFFQPAIDKNKPRIVRTITEAVRKVTNK